MRRLSTENFGIVLWLGGLGLRFRRLGLHGEGLTWDDYLFGAIVLVCAGVYSLCLKRTCGARFAEQW